MSDENFLASWKRAFPDGIDKVEFVIEGEEEKHLQQQPQSIPLETKEENPYENNSYPSYKDKIVIS